MGAATGAEEPDGADDRSWPAPGVMAAAAAAASATVSHEQKGAQEETSLHMRWAPMSVAPTVPEHWLSKAVVQGRLAWQIWLASVQPPQWAVVPHVYLLHLSGGKRGSVRHCDSGVSGYCCMVRGATGVRQW